MNVFKKALVATVASAFVVSGGGVMATAQPAGNPATNAQAAAASIDASRTATLHIHKYSGDPVPGAQNNGLEQTVTGQRDPLAGAQFRIERVTNVDLTTAAGWLQAEQIAKNAEGAPTPTFGEGQSVTTDQNGAATVNNLPLGLYRVTEVAAPARHTKAEPFFVTLPLTHPQERNAWLYDVHVYPKNKKDDRPLTKTVADANKNAGDVIDYRLSSPIPDYERLARFQIQDVYPQDRLEFPDQGQEGRKVEVTAGGTTMTEGTDYVVTDNAPQPGRLTIAFTRAGLDKLDALPRGENPDQRQVNVVLSFRVKEVTGETLGPIENTFNVVENPDGDPSVRPNTPPETPANPPANPPTPEETPKTYHGNVRVIKKNSGDENLAGVEFDVFRCNDANSLQGDAIKRSLPEKTVKR